MSFPFRSLPCLYAAILVKSNDSTDKGKISFWEILRNCFDKRGVKVRNVDNFVDKPVDNTVYEEVGNLLKTRELESLPVKLCKLP